ncbi:MAG: glycerophosphodiester phosphodiesterase [Streptosporangiaceae bacterium]
MLLHGRATVQVDVKNDPNEPGFDGTKQALAAEVLRLLDGLRFWSAIVTSENPETVDWVRRRAPDLATGVEIESDKDLREWLTFSSEQGHPFLLPQVDAVLDAGKDFIDDAHALGVLVDVWTVDDPQTISTLLGWGVDTVETNDPDMAVPLRDLARGS